MSRGWCATATHECQKLQDRSACNWPGTARRIKSVVWGVAEKKSFLCCPTLPFRLRIYQSSSRKELSMPRPRNARSTQPRKAFVLQKPHGQRLPPDPGNKTDDTDLAAICRATTHGFGLLEPTWPEDYVTIQLLRRHRRDLVDKNTILQCQIREVLHAAMPGYAECFCHLWDDSPAPLLFARHTTSADAVRQAAFAGLQQIADHAAPPYPATT